MTTQRLRRCYWTSVAVMIAAALVIFATAASK